MRGRTLTTPRWLLALLLGAAAASPVAAQQPGGCLVTDWQCFENDRRFLQLEREQQRLVAGGWQPIEAYDVLVVNLDPSLDRRAAPDDPAPLLEEFPDGLTTQEVAHLLVRGTEAPDRAAAEAKLLELVADGRVARTPLGDDALWRAA